ncbi:MAG: Tol-Pal system beta propeller repeat protein TolB [Candidatus Dadabacteria bacterium]|nr:Tol-Pal system beta propeller repeat protein TolB [Candidatus Dadabacteria bacterium]NIQ16914.1 Tol-Pal system beta propeller repeat protein TolB [Candidatus Dadabacteria bacterium]
MRIKILIINIVIFLLFSVDTFGQIFLPPVSSPIVKKVSIYVSTLNSVGTPTKSGKEFTDVLTSDLKNAALFEVVSGSVMPSSEKDIDFEGLFQKGVDYLVAGQFQSQSGTTTYAVRVFNVKQKRPILGRNYEASSGNVRKAAHKFANLILESLTGIEGFFTYRIAYVLGSNQNRNIYMMDYDGKNISQLTKHNTVVLSPNCSTDGRKIVFNSDKYWDQDLYVLDLIPRLRERRITKGFKLDQSAEWSPNSSRLAFSRSGDLYIATADGKGLNRLTNSYAIEVSPSWSPDGKQIAFVSDKTGSPQIYVRDVFGGNTRQITNSGYNTDPSWSTNKSINRIAFVRVEGSGSNIYSINPDGSDEQQLTSTGRNETPSWSPDGHYITFSSTKGGAKDIYIMYLNGENQRKLSSGGGKTFPTWCKN